MPPWFADLIARLQRTLAVTTALRYQIDGRIHALGGHHRPRVAGMSWLPARLPAARVPTASQALSTGESVRRRWLRSDRGVLIAERQLTFKIGDLLLRVRDFFGGLGQPSFALHQFAAETFVLASQPLVGVRTQSSLGPRHASHGTPMRSICTAP
jgi:hypothetical protein